MPKRSSTARGGAQRQKPRVQRNVELVRPTTERAEDETIERAKPVATSVATAPAPVEQTEEKISAVTPKANSAVAQLAARRQKAQRSQQRNAANLLTPEHFAYVRKDLLFIAILAAVMVVAIVVLYIVLGSGA